MLKIAPVGIWTIALILAGCSGSTPVRKSTTYPAGDKASVERLTYSVVDSQIFTHLGEEPNARRPQNRFYVIQISVFNSGNEDATIPAMTLVDDAGQSYNELTDGGGVSRWLGVLRHVGPNQSEAGGIVFDAPARHYKLKLTDDTDASDVYADIPLSFAHEQLSHGAEDTSEVVVPGQTPSAPPAKKK